MWTKIRIFVAVFAFTQGSAILCKEISFYPCPIALAVPMINDGIKYFENGSLLYEGLVYPREQYWKEDKSNLTLGCVCNLGLKCFRRCCMNGEILHDNVTCVDAKSAGLISRSEFKIPNDNLSPDIKNLTNLNEHFYILRNRLCPNGFYILEPEIYPEDKFVLDYNGFLKTKTINFPPERYCVDWQIDSNEIRAAVCFAEEQHEITTLASTIEMKLYPFGMIISIPFMIATLLVYATISELRNLYGKTLMCYVACLIYAYSFLAILQLADVSQDLCVSFDFQHFHY